MVVIVSKFTERSLRLYNKKKNLSKTPTYLEDLRQILQLDGLLDEDGCSIQENNNKTGKIL